MSKTKFKNAETIVKDTFLNSIYGGLEGTAEGSTLAADDPRLIGHIHDGLSEDGHAGKINLVSHVDGQLVNANLADGAVLKRNVYSSTDPFDPNLIPHYEDAADGTRHYYIGLGSFDLQSITDNGFQTTNEVVIGRNEASEVYSSMLTVDLPLNMEEDGSISPEKENVLNVMLSGKNLFNWNVIGPQAVSSPSSYTPGVLNGNETEYDESDIPWGIEQRITHDYFGYVSFVGASDNNFSLRVMGLGAVTTPTEEGTLLGASNSDLQMRSFNSNPSLSFWYENADSSSVDFGKQYVVGGLHAINGIDEGNSTENSSSLLLSVRPDTTAKLGKSYPESTYTYGGQVIDEDDWPLIDVVKVSKYGNTEIKRGSAFSNHSESLLNLKEVFGYEENRNSEEELYHNISRNIASIRMEPIIGLTQVEGAEEMLTVSAPSSGIDGPLLPIIPDGYQTDLTDDGMGVVNNHNYIELASIMRSQTENQSRTDRRALSAETSIVAHSNVFKFDRYFIDRDGNGDAHRALENNTTSDFITSARNVLPSVSPFDDQFFSPALMKINIVDGDTPRNFYMPVMYERGRSLDLEMVPLSLSKEEALTRQSEDLDQTSSQYYLRGTNARDTNSYGYFFPLYLTRQIFATELITFTEFPGVAFYIPIVGSTRASLSTPSSNDYPEIELYVNSDEGSNYYV